MGKAGEGQPHCLVSFIDCPALSKAVAICLFSINIFSGLTSSVIFHEESKHAWSRLIVSSCSFSTGCVEIKKKKCQGLEILLIVTYKCKHMIMTSKSFNDKNTCIKIYWAALADDLPVKKEGLHGWFELLC